MIIAIKNIPQLIEQFDQVELMHVEFKFPGFDFRIIQNVIQDPKQRLGRTLGFDQKVVLGFGQLGLLG